MEIFSNSRFGLPNLANQDTEQSDIVISPNIPAMSRAKTARWGITIGLVVMGIAIGLWWPDRFGYRHQILIGVISAIAAYELFRAHMSLSEEYRARLRERRKIGFLMVLAIITVAGTLGGFEYLSQNYNWAWLTGLLEFDIFSETD